jgi:uncharacterized alkaline shock family protein YloU
VTLVLTNDGGTVTVPDHVLVGIAVRAAESVDGIRVRRRRSVDVEHRHVRLSVTARRGEPLLELAGRVQEAVAESLRTMCGIDTMVDVAVGGLE